LPIVAATLVTAVSLYGPKSGPLRDLLAWVQDTVAAELGGSFAPYRLEQVHGTLVVLSGVPDDRVPGAVLNEYYLERRGLRRAMDFERAVAILQERLARPVPIRIGGFGPDDPLPVTSQGRHLYERSFSARAGALVLMGWPVASLASAGNDRPLDELRREMARAGVLHKYHRHAAAVDDDFHLVVGHYRDARPARVRAAAGVVRAGLRERRTEFDVGADQVRILATDSPDLAAPWFSSALPGAAGRLAALYGRPAAAGDQNGAV
jgi:hypothetical protein